MSFLVSVAEIFGSVGITMPCCKPKPKASSPAQSESAKPPKAYNPRHPERTLLYRTVAEHFETWLDLASARQFAGQGDQHTPAP